MIELFGIDNDFPNLRKIRNGFPTRGTFAHLEVHESFKHDFKSIGIYICHNAQESLGILHETAL